MKNFFSFLNKKYIPLNSIEILNEDIISNYRYLSQCSSHRIIPVVKSNAYGHSIQIIGKIVDKLDVPLVCVDSIYEAYELQKAHVKTPILIMGYIAPENLSVKKLPFSYAVYETTLLESIHKYQLSAGIHLFVDTGMHREGISLEDLPHFIKKIQKYQLRIEGIMSHLGMAHKPEDPQTQKQIKNFIKAKEILEENDIFPAYSHILASSGLLHVSEYPQNLGNITRVGLSFYGYDPEGKNTNFLPSLRLVSTIAQVKHIKKGEKIGYDFTYRAKKDMTLALLPIGFHDGVQKRLSNIGCVKIEKQFCPIVGRVSMNMTTIDVTFTNARVGDRVIVYSSNSRDKNSITNVATLCGMSVYEILVQLHHSTKRVSILR